MVVVVAVAIGVGGAGDGRNAIPTAYFTREVTEANKVHYIYSHTICMIVIFYIIFYILNHV